MRWLDSITNSMDLNLSKFQETVKDKEPGCCSPWGCKESDTTHRMLSHRGPGAEVGRNGIPAPGPVTCPANAAGHHIFQWSPLSPAGEALEEIS